MRIETFDQALNLAKEFLATKERKNNYEFKVRDDETGEEACYHNPLDDEEVDSLRALKGKYGDEYTKHIDEVFDDPDYIHDLTGGDSLLDIDLDNILHDYAFQIHTLKPDGTTTVYLCRVELTDDEYVRLLAWHLYDEHFTINILRQRDGSLYDTVMRGIDGHFYQSEGYLWVDNPYVATLDEAQTDVEFIIRQHDIKRGGGYLILMNLR